MTFLVVNYEQVRVRWKQLATVEWGAIICDESHRIARRTSKQSKALWYLSRRVKSEYRGILTGTPIEGDELDLWAQFRFLNPKLLGSSWVTFSRRNCRKTGYMGYKRKLKKHKIKWFYNTIKPYVFQIETRDAVEIPPEIDMFIDFELTGKAKKAYQELEDQFYTKYEDTEVLTRIAIVNMLRLQQLTGGFLDSGEEVIKLEQNKLLTLMDFIEDYPIEKKLVICCRFTAEIDALTAALSKKRKVGVLDGRTKKKDRGIWVDFQTKKVPHIYITQERAGGLGIELFAADTLLFFSTTYSYIDYEQIRRRVCRPGQTKTTKFIHFHGLNTIDKDIFYSVQHKHYTADSVMHQLKRRKTIMAKKDKKSKKSGKKKPTPPPMPKADFGVDYVAKELDIEPFTVRQKLRAAGIRKDGRIYDFGSKKKADEVVAQLKKVKEPKKDKKKKSKKGKSSDD